MQKALFTLFTLLSLSAFGQGRISFEYSDTVSVTMNGQTLSLAWAGGMNSVQFGEIDLDLDGTKDMLAFDREGNRWIPFLRVQQGGATVYKYAPQYIEYLPEIQAWMVIADYNCDGKNDIFHHVNLGIGVMENTSSNGQLNFTWALGNDPYIRSHYAGNYGNLYVLSTDIPAITDVDNDGDLDILTFGGGNTVLFNENAASCGLDFTRVSNCWGGFAENALNNSVTLDACTPSAPGGNTNSTGKVQHSGSTMLIKDFTGDGLPDCLLGDVSFNNSTMVINGGTLTDAYMIGQDSTYPTNDVPVDLYIFPAFFDVDADFDGVNDLVVAPNIGGSKNTENVWFYKNHGTNAVPNLQLESRDWMQKDMMDFGEGSKPVFVDLNSDGLQDLVVSSSGKYITSGVYSSTLYYFQNTGTSQLPSFSLLDTNLGNLSSYGIGRDLHPAFADLTNDGLQDLVVGNGNGTLIYFKNTGTFASPQFTLTDANFLNFDAGENSTPYFFDIDNDGNVDLFVGERQGNINYFKGNGGTSFTLINEYFGGIDVSAPAFNGYSVPSFATVDGIDQMMIGSHTFGVVQFDSLNDVINLPPLIESTFGTDTITSVGAELTPLGTSKRTGRNQILVLASELLAAGYERGNLTSLSLEVASTGNPPMTQGLNIRLKNTLVSSLSGFDDDMTEVYNLATGFNPGWNQINFTSPFEWDGISNLLIEVCFSKNFPQINIDVKMTVTPFTSNAVGDITGWNNNTAKGCNMPYKYTSSQRPNLRLGLVPTATHIESVLKDGYFNAADFADLNGDSYPDAVLGNQSGGLIFYFGGEYQGIGLDEWLAPKAMDLAIFPNPGKDQVTISFENDQLGDKTLRIFSTTGQLVLEMESRNTEEVIKTNFLPSGLYIIEATGKQWRGVARWIKL